MEFKNEIDRWRQIKEFAEYLIKYADYHEMKAIRKCTHYEFDSQSAEEYCWCPLTRGKYGAARGLNGESEEICWKCPNYNTQPFGDENVETGDPRTCPKFQSIFVCKHCEYDTKCGEIISKMTGEEVKGLYAFLRGGTTNGN